MAAALPSGSGSLPAGSHDSATLHCYYSRVPDDDRYTLTELADVAGVTPRTIRYYLGQGLLPAVGQSGPGVRYGPGYLARLLVIRRLQVEHLPLAEIRRRLEGLDEATIVELAGSEPTPPTDSALDYLRSVLAGGGSGSGDIPQSASKKGYLRALGGPGLQSSAAPAAPASAPIERSQWERIVLAPDIELHLRRPLSRSHNKQVERLVTIARELLEEDQP